MRLSVIVPTLNAAAFLEETLAPVCAATTLIPEVLVVDGGSADGTCTLAEELDVQFLEAERGRGHQLAAGAAAVDAPWLLFLHGDTRLQRGWDTVASAFITDPANAERAAVFHLRFDDLSPAAQRVARIAAWRSRRLGLPYGDQGLLISRTFYESLGGFRTIPIMEDVDIVRRIGRHRLVTLDGEAITSARRYRRTGYTARMLLNLLCLASYFAGVPPRWLVRLYG
ncbi:MAG: glycosyl transferase family 2 [Rhodospirillaceae bacterium]|nr:glycosyl transferase family 2 [Rhodospirillaceae bacterium]